MESSKHQSWKISVRARSKGLDFRIDASNIFPHWGKGGEKISLLLRLFRFFSLKVESKNQIRPRKTKRKSKIFYFLAKIFPRPRELMRSKLATKKRSQVRSPKIGSPPTDGCHHPYHDMVVAMMASLFLLSHSAAEKDGSGVIIHALAFILCPVLLLKKRKTRSDLFWASGVVSLVGFCMSFLSYMGLVAKAAWRVWNVIISLGCSFAFYQALLSRTSLIIETRRMILLIVLVLLPSFFYKLGEPKYLDALGVYISSANSLVKGICNIFGATHCNRTVPYVKDEFQIKRYGVMKLLETLLGTATTASVKTED